jgi:hypothetical protein
MRERAQGAASDPDWDGDFFRFYHKRLADESWQDQFADEVPGRNEQPWSTADNDSAIDYSRALFGGPGADLLGSGYSTAEQEPVAEQRWDSGPQSISMPSLSQPMPPVEGNGRRWDSGPPSGSIPAISMPSISASMPALNGPPASSWEEPADTGSLMRPYARTRGRTRSDYDLAIETLVSTSERGRSQTAAVTAEHRSICGLCQEARSVAEISAHLRLPLGVVRVLIGDMANLGLLLIHNSGMVVGDRPSMEFLERVLSGLRKL